ncbi:MAG: 50S ribosomal protein L11 methyltransferase [Candidatus Binatia bacterium]
MKNGQSGAVYLSTQSSDSGPRTPDPRLPQRWHCLAVTVPHEAVEAVTNFLVELGSIGVVEGVRDLTQPPAAATEVQGFFPAEVSGSMLRDTFARYLTDLSVLFPSLGHPSPHLVEVTSEAWHERWREHFPPVSLGERFFLLPPWAAVPQNTDRIVIVINPSMAFGTGHHATTQGCLTAIESLHERYGAPERAFDLGTGSGILAIALAQLGSHVWATDTDPVALDEASKNAEANHVRPCIHLSDTPTEKLPLPFPLVVANLFATTLIALAPVLETAVERQGHAILSGIQTDQEADVCAAYPPPAWRLIARQAQDEWVTLVLQRAQKQSAIRNSQS